MEEFIFETKTQMQNDFMCLIIDSLKNISTIINLSKNNNELVFKEGDDGFLSVLYSACGAWMDNALEKFEETYENGTSITMNRRELMLIKYLTEMYWHHTASFDISYKGFDLEKMFEDLETPKTDLKKILKVVK